MGSSLQKLQDITIDYSLNEVGEIYSPLSTECQQDFIKNLKISSFKKGEIVIREGQYPKKSYLILKGCARAYYLKGCKI